MARFFKVALQAGIPFGIFMFLFWVLSSGDDSLSTNIGRGVVSGILFGILMAAFSEYQYRKTYSYDPTSAGEELLRSGGANHRKGWEPVGGRLYLTSKRLLFVSHSFNLQNHELSIPLEEVTQVRRHLTMGFIPNGMEVVRGEGKERFVLQDRRGWLKDLQERLSVRSR